MQGILSSVLQGRRKNHLPPYPRTGSFSLKLVSMLCTTLFLALTLTLRSGEACEDGLPPFQGFGVFLGSVNHFANSPKEIVDQVVDRVYSDLGIRFFRTSYESQFSPEPNNYTISCTLSPYACTWMRLVDSVSKYDNVSVFASVWSPPHYMKNPVLDTLKESHEKDFYYFIKNITEIIKQKFNGLQIERVSPVNEPENVFAPWEHTNMPPSQLCGMVKEMNDSQVSICPENSYFWVTEIYANYTDKSSGVSCASSCDIYATHGYTLDIDYWSPYRFYAYYDLGRYSRFTQKPIWMTEVSSTFPRNPTVSNQLKEGLDLATHITNFVGSTCVQRYYFWSMYTEGGSGESLIWGNFSDNNEPHSAGNETTFTLYYPKTYHVFKHFTKASFGGDKYILDCKITRYDDDHLQPKIRKPPHAQLAEEQQLCLKFYDKIGNKSATVFVNRGDEIVKLKGANCVSNSPLCCTTQEFDWWCISNNSKRIWYKDDDVGIILPKKSVCSCQTSPGDPGEFIATSSVFSNEV